jgi:hypothetical protein
MLILTLILSEKKASEQSDALSDIGKERTKNYSHMNE